MDLVHDLPFFAHNGPGPVLYGHGPRNKIFVRRLHSRVKEESWGRTTRAIAQV